MDKFNGKKILVFGGSGFIASHLCDKLIKKDIKKLIIFDNLSASTKENIDHLLEDERVEFIKGDIYWYKDVEKYISESDIVFNLACSNVGNSIINPQDDLNTNIIGTFNILEAIKKYPEVRLIHTSSGSIKNPTTPYAINKLTGENYCKFYAKEYGLKISILRPHHVFGPKQSIEGKSGVINKFLYRILINKSPIVFGDGSSIKNFTFVWDTVNAILLLAEKDKSIGKVYDVASDVKITIKKLAKLLIERYAQDKEMKLIYTDAKIGENTQLFPDTTDIKRLGWKQKWDFGYGLAVSKSWVEKEIRK